MVNYYKYKMNYLILLLLVPLVTCMPNNDFVATLEPFPSPLAFPLYSGYLPINGTSKSLHYMALPAT